MPIAPEVAEQLITAGRERSAADHAESIRAYYPFWDTRYRPHLLQAVAALPPEHFDFKPRPEMLTAHQVILHIAETEPGWVQGVVEGGSSEDFVARHEDPAQGWVTLVDAPDHALLGSLLETCHRHTQRWLEKPPSELSRVFTWKNAEGVERRATLHWIMDHLQEHEIHHRGQLILYLRLLGIEPPGI